MPQMGVSVAEGTLVEWRKQVGDRVDADEVVCSISTDKIDTDVESPAAGTLVEILVDVGTTVDVGTVLATIETGDGDGTAAEPEPPNTEALSEAEVALEAPGAAGDLSGDTTADHPAPAAQPAVKDAGGRRYSPVVQRIAAEHGIDLSRVPGTGRG